MGKAIKISQLPTVSAEMLEGADERGALMLPVTIADGEGKGTYKASPGDIGLDAIAQKLRQETIDRQALAERLQNQAETLRGAIIYLGNINCATAGIAAEPSLLDALCLELRGHKPELGYCIVDSEANDWIWNGTEWVNIGWYEVATATNSSKGVVKGGTEAGKVSVDPNGEMKVNGFGELQTQIASAADSKVSKSGDSMTGALVNSHAVTQAQLGGTETANAGLTASSQSGTGAAGPYPAITFHHSNVCALFLYLKNARLRVGGWSLGNNVENTLAYTGEVGGTWETVALAANNVASCSIVARKNSVLKIAILSGSLNPASMTKEMALFTLSGMNVAFAQYFLAGFNGICLNGMVLRAQTSGSNTIIYLHDYSNTPSTIFHFQATLLLS